MPGQVKCVSLGDIEQGVPFNGFNPSVRRGTSIARVQFTHQAGIFFDDNSQGQSSKAVSCAAVPAPIGSRPAVRAAEWAKFSPGPGVHPVRPNDHMVSTLLSFQTDARFCQPTIFAIQPIALCQNTGASPVETHTL